MVLMEFQFMGTKGLIGMKIFKVIIMYYKVWADCICRVRMKGGGQSKWIFDFTGNASLIVDGVAGKPQMLTMPNNAVYESGISPIGATSLSLPQNGIVRLQLQVSYTFKRAEGVAVPMPGFNRTFNIPLHNPGYVSPKN
jgi:hypothetical protein